jgi:ATP-binding cassette subfamily B protein
MGRPGGGGGMGPGYQRRLREERKHASIRDIKLEDLRFIFPLLRKQAGYIVLAVVLTVFAAGISILTPYLIKILLDNYITAGYSQGLTTEIFNGIISLSFLLMASYGANWIVSYGQTRVTIRVAQSVIRDLRRVIYKQILFLSLRFNNERKKGELLSLVINDVDVLSDAFSSGIINVFSDIISIVGVLAVMILIDVFLTALSLVIIPILIGGIWFLRKRISAAYVEVRRKIAVLNANVEENLAGIRVVKALNVESRKNRDFTDLSQINFQANMKATVLFGILSSLIAINSFIAFALVIGLGGHQLLFGTITLGDLVAFFQYLLTFLRPVQDLVSTYGTFQEAAAALQHISEYMRFPIDVPEPTPEKVRHLPSPVQGKIELRDISFSYTEEPFIEHMNLTIQPGEKIGIVGETGAGKTTTINLITRLYDVTAGSVCIDGIDVRSLKSQELRSCFSMVSQNAVIFSDNVKNNIRFGRPSATDDEVIEAAKLANAHAFIEKMPYGYDSMLGDRGSNVSGGQKQLIAYARLILAKPRIAILDEATSNIDSYTEDLIQRNMRNVLSNCTTIIIAHRFATLKAVDRLILIENGNITDEGTHDELYERNEFYQKLYDTQYSKF